MTENLSEKYREKIARFILMDDIFMNKVFEDKKCAQLLLKIILEKELTVTEVKTQYAVNSLQGRAARLDIWAVDENNKLYNVEVQNENEDATPMRARYNCSLIDANVLKKGGHWDELPETYVIFITRNDVLGEERPIYHIDRIIRESGKEFVDKSHIVYVNSKIRDDTSLGKLMHDFYCKDADEMCYNELAIRTGYFKKNEEGVKTMCTIMEELIEEGRAEGRAEGRTEGRAEGRAEGRIEGRTEGKLLMIEACKEFGVSLVETVKKIAEKFKMTEEEAEIIVRENW